MPNIDISVFIMSLKDSIRNLDIWKSAGGNVPSVLDVAKTVLPIVIEYVKKGGDMDDARHLVVSYVLESVKVAEQNQKSSAGKWKNLSKNVKKYLPGILKSLSEKKDLDGSTALSVVDDWIKPSSSCYSRWMICGKSLVKHIQDGLKREKESKKDNRLSLRIVVDVVVGAVKDVVSSEEVKTEVEKKIEADVADAVPVVDEIKMEVVEQKIEEKDLKSTLDKIEIQMNESQKMIEEIENKIDLQSASLSTPSHVDEVEVEVKKDQEEIVQEVVENSLKKADIALKPLIPRLSSVPSPSPYIRSGKSRQSTPVASSLSYSGLLEKHSSPSAQSKSRQSSPKISSRVSEPASSMTE
jgi:hypothetical protein